VAHGEQALDQLARGRPRVRLQRHALVHQLDQLLRALLRHPAAAAAARLSPRASWHVTARLSATRM